MPSIVEKGNTSRKKNFINYTLPAVIDVGALITGGSTPVEY